MARSAHRYNDTRPHVHALKCRNIQEYDENVRLRGPKEVPLPSSNNVGRVFGADWVSMAVSRSWPKPLLMPTVTVSLARAACYALDHAAPHTMLRGRRDRAVRRRAFQSHASTVLFIFSPQAYLGASYVHQTPQEKETALRRAIENGQW